MEFLDTLVLSVTMGFITILGSAGVFLIASSDDTKKEALKAEVRRFSMITLLVITAAILYFLPLDIISNALKVLAENSIILKAVIVLIVYSVSAFFLARLVREVWS